MSADFEQMIKAAVAEYERCLRSLLEKATAGEPSHTLKEVALIGVGKGSAQGLCIAAAALAAITISENITSAANAAAMIDAALKGGAK